MMPDFFIITLSDIVGLVLMGLILLGGLVYGVVAYVRMKLAHYRTRNTPPARDQRWWVSGQDWRIGEVTESGLTAYDVQGIHEFPAHFTLDGWRSKVLRGNGRLVRS